MPLDSHVFAIMSASSHSEITARIAALLEPMEEALEAYVFGSWARGQDQPHSDIDIAVYVQPAGLSDRGFGYRAELDFSRPGKPSDNAFIESFNATLRRECLSQHWFTSLEDAQRTLGVWLEDYDNTRPHGSLADVPPAEYRAGGYYVPDRHRLENSLM